MAHSTGCRVLVTDMTYEGLRVAAGRMQDQGVPGAVLAASGAALPIRSETFDAATCSDVFC